MGVGLNQPHAEDWIRDRLRVTGPIDLVHERPWSSVFRVPHSDGVAWFKSCGSVEAFEPELSSALSSRWPGLVAQVIAHDSERGWLLLADAGLPVGIDTPPETWLAVLPRYAELQRGETDHAGEHLAAAVPDLREMRLHQRFEQLLGRNELPLDAEEVQRLRRFEPRYEQLCAELMAAEIPATIQHDDLHGGNVHKMSDKLRVLDWGDSSIAHPFFSLVVTFRFLDEITRLPPDDPWFSRLRDAYLEPWGRGLTGVFELALRVGAVAHCIAWGRQRDFLSGARPEFDKWFAVVLRRAIARIGV